ncbi:MAG TPA: UBP-type zinc finger domain-containing protein [Candidatus Dojkabacteria bacterium]|jgi:uncharacterized UBP type Zn finger protein
MSSTCEHLKDKNSQNIIPKSNYVKFECEECIKIKSWWAHLRICQTCGKMLCCDSSPNKHATKHFLESGHEVISSAEMGEKWLYCYKDQLMKEY